MKKPLAILLPLLILLISCGKTPKDDKKPSEATKTPSEETKTPTEKTVTNYYYQSKQKESEGKSLEGDFGFYDQPGQRIGIWTFWSLDGMDSTQLEYKNGIKWTGTLTSWYENGQKKSEETYKDGKGALTWWNVGDLRIIDGNYKDGMMDGKWTFWYANGQKALEGAYKSGYRDGKWTYWSLDGKDSSKIKLFKDQYLSKRSFNQDSAGVFYHLVDYNSTSKRTELIETSFSPRKNVLKTEFSDDGTIKVMEFQSSIDLDYIRTSGFYFPMTVIEIESPKGRLILTPINPPFGYLVEFSIVGFDGINLIVSGSNDVLESTFVINTESFELVDKSTIYHR